MHALVCLFFLFDNCDETPCQTIMPFNQIVFIAWQIYASSLGYASQPQECVITDVSWWYGFNSFCGNPHFSLT